MEKFVLAVVAVYLLVGVSSATSTLLRHGNNIFPVSVYQFH